MAQAMQNKGKAFDWITVKIKDDLIQEIDKEIANTYRFGVPTYRSRSDFVKIACVALLHKERRKNSGEEILVARKQ